MLRCVFMGWLIARNSRATAVRCAVVCCFKALAAWQWSNYWHSQIPAGRRPLRLNLDETAICLFQGGGKGNVFVTKSAARVGQHATRGQRRTYLSHVAVICDEPAIQPLLPQVIIGNEHTVQARRLAGIRARCPTHVHVLRRKSAWVNAAVMAQIIRLIGAVLRPFMGEYQPIISFDACKAHLHATVFATCAAQGLWPHLVAAKMTRWIQVLDTHGFAAYKTYLQKAVQDARMQSANGVVDVGMLIECICASISGVLEARSWADAFDGDGWGASQVGVRQRLLREFQLEAPLAVSAEKPEVAQLQHCFPKRMRVPAAAIWLPLQPAGAAAAVAKAAGIGASLRRSARVAAHAKAGAVAGGGLAMVGGAAVAASPSSFLGAVSKARGARPPPKAAAHRHVAPGPAAARPAPKAGGVSKHGMATRSRSRAVFC